MIPGVTEASYERIINTISSFPEIEKVTVFGSRAKGNYKHGSDIDLALFGKKCSIETAMSVESILNEKQPIPYFIDVISYSTITNPNLKEHIDRVGKVIYEKNS